jgi:predicted nucleotidyltransferase
MVARASPQTRGDVLDLVGGLVEEVPGVRSAIVFGSWARGTATPGLSDIDVLLIVEHRSRAVGVRQLARSLSDGQLSVLVHDTQSLGALARSDWSFVEHLRREQLSVHGHVEELRGLHTRLPARVEIREQIAEHLPVALDLHEPERLAGRHLLAYGRLFAATKSAAILDGIAEGQPMFDRGLALSMLAARRPRLAEPLAQIGRLEPFWLRMRRGEHVPVPWSPRRDAGRLIAHATAAARILRELSLEP